MPTPAIIIIANIHSEGLVSPVFGEATLCTGLADAGCGVAAGAAGAGVVLGGITLGSCDTAVSTYTSVYVENLSVSNVNICVVVSKLPSKTAATPSCILITL